MYDLEAYDRFMITASFCFTLKYVTSFQSLVPRAAGYKHQLLQELFCYKYQVWVLCLLIECEYWDWSGVLEHRKWITFYRFIL